MSAALIVIDLLAVFLMLVGFHLAFRQESVRRWWSIIRKENHGANHLRPLTDDDPARYALRISGVMILAFGLTITLLFTLSYCSSLSKS